MQIKRTIALGLVCVHAEESLLAYHQHLCKGGERRQLLAFAPHARVRIGSYTTCKAGKSEVLIISTDKGMYYRDKL